MQLSSDDIKSMISSWESPVLEFKLKTAGSDRAGILA